MEKLGLPVPDLVGQRPSIPQEFGVVYDTFWRLSASRAWVVGPAAMVPMAIAFDCLCVAAEAFGYTDPDELCEFIDLTQAMDNEWIAATMAKLNKE